jgi:hypothetical protein
MTTRSANGLHLTEPIETPITRQENGGTDWSGWETWLRSHLNIERGITGEAFEAVDEIVAGLRQEIVDSVGPLERQVAELRGGLDVMRSLGHAGLRLRGSYDSTAIYLAHDVVTHEGSAFAACKDKAGACPGPDWQLLASRGSRGERGGRGPRGMSGGRGEPAPAIKGWLINKAKFTASPILTNGSVGAPLELRALFQEFLDQTRTGA